MPRQKKDEAGNVIPSEPKTNEQILDNLTSRLAVFAMTNQINKDAVFAKITEKFSTETEKVREAQVKQLASQLTMEELTKLIEQAGIKKAA